MTSTAEALDGVEPLDTTRDEIEAELPEEQSFEDGTEHAHFRTAETHLIQIGESVGNPIFVESDHFLALSVDFEHELGPQEILQKQMQGEEIEMPEEGDEAPTEYVNEATVVVSNEDGVPGGGVLTVDGAGLDDVLEAFEEEYL